MLLAQTPEGIDEGDQMNGRQRFAGECLAIVGRQLCVFTSIALLQVMRVDDESSAGVELFVEELGQGWINVILVEPLSNVVRCPMLQRVFFILGLRWRDDRGPVVRDYHYRSLLERSLGMR